MELYKIEIGEGFPRWLNILEINDSGGLHGRCLSPDMDISGEVQEIKDAAASVWTDEIKSQWATFQAEVKAEQDAEQAKYE